MSAPDDSGAPTFASGVERSKGLCDPCEPLSDELSRRSTLPLPATTRHAGVVPVVAACAAPLRLKRAAPIPVRIVAGSSTSIAFGLVQPAQVRGRTSTCLGLMRHAT